MHTKAIYGGFNRIAGGIALSGLLVTGLSLFSCHTQKSLSGSKPGLEKVGHAAFAIL